MRFPNWAGLQFGGNQLKISLSSVKLNIMDKGKFLCLDSNGSLGICIKTLDRHIRFQNKRCIELCGSVPEGKECTQGCMKHYKSGVGDVSFDQGLRLVRNVEVPLGRADAVIINDGVDITTFLFDKQELVNRRIAYLETFHLTPTELEVMRNVLAGMTNQEVADALFISKGTLRTHLNNIYKKIPVELKHEILVTLLSKSFE